MNGNDITTTERPQILSLEFLVKLIPDTFDGDRYKLRSFIKQVDAAFELSQPFQHRPLLSYTKSKIIGKAREQVDIHCNLTTWPEVADLLLTLYQDRKSLDQLLEELNNMKQEYNENVTQFYQRLEELTSRILGLLHSSESAEDTLQGRLAMINDITLNRFIYHTHPQISQMLRYREFRTISQAFTAAIGEEKALRLTYPTRICKNCHRTNHSTHECFSNNRKPQFVQSPKPVHYQNVIRSSHQNYPNTSSNFYQRTNNTSYQNHPNSASGSTQRIGNTPWVNRQSSVPNSYQRANNASQNGPVKQCNYCKNIGHVISECRKREYNNSRRHVQFQSPVAHNSSTCPPKRSNVNFQQQNFWDTHQSPNPPNPIMNKQTPCPPIHDPDHLNSQFEKFLI